MQLFDPTGVRVAVKFAPTGHRRLRLQSTCLVAAQSAERLAEAPGASSGSTVSHHQQHTARSHLPLHLRPSQPYRRSTRSGLGSAGGRGRSGPKQRHRKKTCSHVGRSLFRGQEVSMPVQRRLTLADSPPRHSTAKSKLRFIRCQLCIRATTEYSEQSQRISKPTQRSCHGRWQN